MRPEIKRLYYSLFLKNRRLEFFVSKVLLNLRFGNHFHSANSIFEPSKILRRLNFFTDSKYPANRFYGMEKSLRKFARFQKPIDACIEHGLFFGDYFVEKETNSSPFGFLITFSHYRKDIVRRHSKIPVLCIGPYINYCDILLSQEEMLRVKASLGKTLLAFPSHSIPDNQTNFSKDEFVDYLSSLKREHHFDSIVVCEYYVDYLRDKGAAYSKAGFKVVCCGSREDPLFLSRLKTFIMLSDVTASNEVGTNLGYCIFLGKPHIYFPQKQQYLLKTGKIEIHPNSFYKDKKSLGSLFTDYSETISSRQIEAASFYWGFDCILDASSLHGCFEYFRKYRVNKEPSNLFEGDQTLCKLIQDMIL